MKKYYPVFILAMLPLLVPVICTYLGLEIIQYVNASNHRSGFGTELVPLMMVVGMSFIFFFIILADYICRPSKKILVRYFVNVLLFLLEAPLAIWMFRAIIHSYTADST
ncbi:hypothetical protein [Gimesia sp.]|uniref:hypothetical protein n=1 Tax=Gimesia sp. TaxID=2024833 RepID=UPI003A91954C